MQVVYCLKGGDSHGEPPLEDVYGEGYASGDSASVEGVDVEDLIAGEARGRSGRYGDRNGLVGENCGGVGSW